jgi:hypothetical protein
MTRELFCRWIFYVSNGIERLLKSRDLLRFHLLFNPHQSSGEIDVFLLVAGSWPTDQLADASALWPTTIFKPCLFLVALLLQQLPAFSHPWLWWWFPMPLNTHIC